MELLLFVELLAEIDCSTARKVRAPHITQLMSTHRYNRIQETQRGNKTGTKRAPGVGYVALSSTQRSTPTSPLIIISFNTIIYS